MFILETESIPWEPVTGNHRTGNIRRKFVREGELARGVGYTCDLVHYHRGAEVFTAPRHRHDFSQIRMTIEGTTDYGDSQIGDAGDTGYFPAGAFYGPERFEEAEIFLIQWSRDWVTREKSDAAFKRLSERGRFEGGHYITTDDNGAEVRKDGANAVWEEVNQRQQVIPTPKYATPILMHPAGYDWEPAGEAAQVKDLGHFTEDDINVTVHRWEQGGTIPLTPERTQIVWVADGSVRIGDRTVGARALFFSDAGEAHEVEGVDAGSATILRMPKSR